MELDKKLVKYILEDAHRFDWSLQGFGMLRLYLSKETRLHVWDDRYKVKNVSDIHNHPWSFRSQIIAGVMHEYQYQKSETLGFFYSGALIQCGENACVKEMLPPVRMQNHPKTYYESMEYELSEHVIHSSHPLSGTVTVVHRYFKPDTEHAKVYWPVFGNDPGWIDAKPRKAKPKEVKDICGNALERHFK